MLELRNVSYHVTEQSSDLPIINDISLTLDDGKLIVLTGPNGGGKSTLAKLVMGLARPTSGSILFDGQDITDFSITERARLGIGYAFQQPPRFKGLTVREMLSLAAGAPIATDTCNQYLLDVGLCSKDYLDRDVDKSLSGGEVKRIEIATILARDLKLAIYDEPEAGIDLWSFSILTETFRNIHARNKGSILIISHQERILEISDEIVLIEGGTIREQGPRGDVLPRIMEETAAGLCAYTA